MGAQQSTLGYLCVVVSITIVTLLYVLWKNKTLFAEHAQMKSLMNSFITQQDLADDVIPSIQNLEKDTYQLRGDLNSILLSAAPELIGKLSQPSPCDHELEMKVNDSNEEQEFEKYDTDDESNESENADSDQCPSLLSGMHNMAMLMSMGQILTTPKAESCSMPVTRVIVDNLSSSDAPSSQAKKDSLPLGTIAEVADDLE